MLGQLGDSEKIPQPSPVSAKLETQATPATKKAEPKTASTKTDLTTAATKSQPTSAPIKDVPTVPTPKPKMEPVQMQPTTATSASTQIKLQTTIMPTISKVSPVTEEKQPLATELSIPTLAPVQQKLVTPKGEVLNTEEKDEEAVKTELSVTELPKAEESKTDLPKVKAEVGVSAASTVSVSEATAVPTSHIAAEAATDRVVPESETKPEIKLTEPTKSLPKVDVQPKSREPQPVSEPVIEADIKEVANKVVEKIIDVTSPSETKPVSTKDITVKVRMGHLH